MPALLLLLLLLLGVPAAAAPASCILDQSSRLPEAGTLRHDAARQAGLFRSQLRWNADGAPNAYHPSGLGCLPGQASCLQDRGLLHICNGVNVRDASGAAVPGVECRWPDGRLQPIPGKEGCPAGSVRSSQRCLDTFRAARAADFPSCGAGKACVSNWVGIAQARGQPLRWPEGHPFAGFFVSKTALNRPAPGVPGGRGYVDANTVPYITIPGGSTLAVDWGLGGRTGAMAEGRAELAVVAWQGRHVFAVVADSGPADELGEASGALLRRLRGADPSDWARPTPVGPESPAVTLLLPGHSRLLAGQWPLTEEAVRVAGQAALRSVAERAGGWERIAACDPALAAAFPDGPPRQEPR